MAAAAEAVAAAAAAASAFSLTDISEYARTAGIKIPTVKMRFTQGTSMPISPFITETTTTCSAAMTERYRAPRVCMVSATVRPKATWTRMMA